MKEWLVTKITEKISTISKRTLCLIWPPSADGTGISFVLWALLAIHLQVRGVGFHFVACAID